MTFFNATRLVVASLSLGVLLLIFLTFSGGKPVFAQRSSNEASAPKNDTAKEDTAKKDAASEGSFDEYQRSGQLFYMQRMAKSGWERGQEIYLMDCWICHNDYTVKADPKAAPTLRGLYKRPKMMMTGQPVNDGNVAAQIRDGSPRMPGFRVTLNDKDMADLLAYLRDKCCWDEQNPQVNPRYRAQ